MAYKRNRYGSIITSTGETITKKMQNEYKKAIDRANYRREALISKAYDQVKNLPTMTNISKEVFAKNLQDKGFIPVKLSKSLKNIDSRNTYKSELKDVKTLAKPQYHNEKVDTARSKMLEQIDKNYNSDGEKLRDVISKLTDQEFMMMYMTAPNSLIANLYGSDQQIATSDLASSTMDKLDIAIHNITPKNNREQRMLELGFWHRNDEGTIIYGRKGE